MARQFDGFSGIADGGNKGIEGGEGGERSVGSNAATDKEADNGSGSLHSPEDYTGGVTKTRTGKRGRPALPRDAEGNIIRDGSEGTQRGTETGPKKPKGVALGFRPNNREAIRGSIQGMHAMAATLLSQPVLLLSDANASNLSERLADVLDYHKINITGDNGPWGLYIALAMCGYGIYKPMLDTVAKGGGMELTATRATMAATPGDAKSVNIGGMDFSADAVPGTDKTVDETMREPEEPPKGVFNYV